MNKKFATVINCIDGRVQSPVIEYIQNNFSVDYVDMITEPGPNKILSEGKEKYIIESLKRKVEISVKNHDSQIIVVVAHDDCAGNPGNEELQKKQLHMALGIVLSWGLPVKKIIALWLDKNFKPNVTRCALDK